MTRAVGQRISDRESVLETTEQHSVTQFTEIAKDLSIRETKVKSIAVGNCVFPSKL